MAEYLYKAIDSAGYEISGSIEASDRRSAIASLSQKGHFVSTLTACDKADRYTPSQSGARPDNTASGDRGVFTASLSPFFLRSRRVTNKDVLAIVTQLSTALKAGLPLLSCLDIIRRQQSKPAVKQLLGELSESVSSGMSLSEAMAKHPRYFSTLCCALIHVGETGGILDETSTQLTQLLTREQQIRTNMKNASAYPLFVLGIGLLSVIIIVTWILPHIIGTITGGTVLLPWPTRMLLGISSFIKHYGVLTLIGVIAGTISFRKWTRSAAGRLHWDRFKLKIPVLGPVLRSIAVGRFARMLGSLTRSGVTILESLKVVRDTLGNEVLARAIDDVTQRVRAGDSVADPLAQSGQFPPLLVQITSVGEQTGKLDELLLNAANTFDADADAAITRFMAVMPAVLILLLAAVIGFIVAATLLPIVVMELSAGGI